MFLFLCAGLLQCFIQQHKVHHSFSSMGSVKGKHWRRLVWFVASALALIVSGTKGIDIFLEWDVSIDSNARPFSADQPVITINGQFPGPLINITTNDMVHVNIINNLDERMTWCIICNGIYLSFDE
ncbi:hypothetical protein Sjap_013714 [Stephania japonica]|uniref:Plastocyanin-like domain-containing protein n=1 Tax=Stephania japonica TaxID=461633 RepID=A0AAP0J0E8_9MAGN